MHFLILQGQILTYFTEKFSEDFLITVATIMTIIIPGVPGTVLNVLYIWSQLIVTIILGAVFSIIQMNKERFKWLFCLTKGQWLVRSGIKMHMSLMQTSCSWLLHWIPVSACWRCWGLVGCGFSDHLCWKAGGSWRFSSSLLEGFMERFWSHWLCSRSAPEPEHQPCRVAHWHSSSQLFLQDALDNVTVTTSRNPFLFHHTTAKVPLFS